MRNLQGGRNVLVFGTGTIGEPLLVLFAKKREQLGIDNIIFTKLTPRPFDIPKVDALCRQGALFAVPEEKIHEFNEQGMRPSLSLEEALGLAKVVVDCTPKKVGRENKEKIYKNYESSINGFLAQGSEKGFGKPYAYGIGHDVLEKAGQYIWIVSCNTHAISNILWTIAFDQGEKGPDNLQLGDFVLVRRVGDISQVKGQPSIAVDPHTVEHGTHQAEDACTFFQSALGWHLPLFSSAMIGPHTDMHTTRFCLHLAEEPSREEILRRVRRNPVNALTRKKNSNLVFSFGRDHGHCGRILNQAVIVEETITVSSNRVYGMSFTPQDGNSLASSTAATLFFLNPEKYKARMEVLLDFPLIFSEV